MYHIIMNPTAGKERVRRKAEEVKKIFAARGVEFTVYETTHSGEAKEIAQKLTSATADAADAATDKPIDLIVVGGDGTLHEALGGIQDLSRCRLGLIPLGTGNDFAAAAGIPEDVEKAAEIILDGAAKETDCLEVDGVRCMNVAGLGIDVDVLVRCNKGKMHGKLKYLMSLIRSLFSFKGIELEYESGEKRGKHKALIAAACNGKQFGGGIKICPSADISDGQMDVIVVDCIGFFAIIKAFIKLMGGKILEYPAAHHFRADRLVVRPSTPCTVQLDGELYDNLAFDVKVCKGLMMYR